MTNLLIVEVKPKNASIERMVEDLEKLTYFRKKLKDATENWAGYFEAFFWIYGLQGCSCNLMVCGI